LEIYPVRKLPAFILEIVEIESISSLFLPAGRQGGREISKPCPFLTGFT